MHAGFDLPIDGILHTRAPYRLREADAGESDAEFVARLAAELDALIRREGPETVAAFIAEPVQAAGGVIVPPEGYFPAIQEVLRRHDVLLIADEVVCGFGRLGTWFGSELLGIEARPDHCRQGHHLGLRPPVGAASCPSGSGGCLSDAGGQRRIRPRLHVHLASRRRGLRTREPRPDRARRLGRSGR